MTTTGKRFEYTASLDRAGRASAEGGATLEPDEAWTPEHLVLAGLLKCSLTSLTYHARRAGLDIVGAGTAEGVVERREEDGRFAFTEIDVRFEIELDPVPDDLDALIAKAERDCFVGASLRIKPHYDWSVNP
ncbi:MAG: OsmC family protein [Gaiellaceae bacterium]